jgi:hypothetical protein
VSTTFLRFLLAAGAVILFASQLSLFSPFGAPQSYIIVIVSLGASILELVRLARHLIDEFTPFGNLLRKAIIALMSLFAIAGVVPAMPSLIRATDYVWIGLYAHGIVPICGETGCSFLAHIVSRGATDHCERRSYAVGFCVVHFGRSLIGCRSWLFIPAPSEIISDDDRVRKVVALENQFSLDHTPGSFFWSPDAHLIGVLDCQGS